MTTKTGTWVRVCSVDELPEGSRRLVDADGRKVALFRTASGIYAVDDRCPHRGYGLVRGEVRDDVLTCEWHNWKFSLADGRCLLGGED
ncbi:MAG TPA: Rieske (2Fe-2S) protein, partial [Actinobacteria bacterium]|nr:Rieske (2Fe-2S) protein [Actinomycetota bacterium]